MKLHFLALLPLALLLSGCALSSRQQSDYARVENSGVSPAIYDKMINGDPLGISDIIALSRAHVPSDIVIRYLRDHETVYAVTPDAIQNMEKAGVDPSIVDYILQTAQSGWWGYGAYPYFGYNDPYWYGWYGGQFYGGYFSYGYHRGGWHHGHWAGGHGDRWHGHPHH